MNRSSAEYIPQQLASRLHRQAIRVWMMAMLVVFAWNLLILVPAVAESIGLSGLAAPLYKFFSYICHQLPERSFHIFGHQFGVCSRCFGVYFGLLAGVAVYPLWRRIDEIEPITRFWLFLSLVPIGIDWSLTAFGIWENTFLSRFLTGLILGVACATFIIPALVEIARNLSFRRFAASPGP